MVVVLGLTVVLGEMYIGYRVGDNVDQTQQVKEKEPIAPIDKGYLAKMGIEPFITHLPVLMIDTGGMQLTKDREHWGKIGIYDNPEGQNDILELPDEVIDCRVKLRGNSSYGESDKNQYRIQLHTKQQGPTYNYPLVGMGAHSEWVLYGPFLDQTLIRNSLCYELAEEMMEWAPDSRYVEVFRDGLYEGVYLVIETIGRGESRLPIYEFGLLSGQTAYILERNRVGAEEQAIQSWGMENGRTMNELSIAYPKNNKLTQNQKEWIERDISQFEAKLYSGDESYDEEMDRDNFVDYYILNEVTMNLDAGKLSTYTYKDIGGKLKMVVWDFNNTFDYYRNVITPYDQPVMKDAPWFDQLLKDEAFVKCIGERYKGYRQHILNTEKIHKTIKDKIVYLGDAIERNNKVWGYTFKIGMFKQDNKQDRNVEGYEQSIAYLMKCIEERLAYMDNYME